MRFDEVIGLWREGAAPARAAPIPRTRPALERVRDELVVELRRRLGGPFTAQELARAVRASRGPTGALTIATRVAPGHPGGLGS